MLRVTTAEEAARTIITIDGELLADCIEIVEACCGQAALKGKPVHLFLRDVSTVDQAGRILLCRLAAKDVHLLAKGVYTSYLVQALSPRRTEPPNFSPETERSGAGSRKGRP